MPKEYIVEHASPGKTPNAAKITWSREDAGGAVQIAVFHKDGTYEQEHTLPQYLTCDRRMINDLIRVLRRARDQAYGRDE